MYWPLSRLSQDLYNNIIISGGTTLYPGFQERLEQDVRRLAPPTIDGSSIGAVAGGAPAIKLLTAHAPHRDSLSAISQPTTGVSLSALQARGAARLLPPALCHCIDLL